MEKTETVLEKEFKYYLDNQEALVNKYNGKYLVIIGEEVVGAYETKEGAYFETEKKYPLGTFLIQYCEPGEKSYTQAYHSRVTF